MANKRLKTNTEILTNGKLEGLTYRSENVVELIQNKAFKSDLQSYLKTETDGQKAAWKLVRILGKMAGEIKQDFGSDYAFASFMNMSQSVINKRKRLAEFAIELEKIGYTDSKAYELLPLIKKLEPIETHEKRLEAFKQILEMLSPDMTQKELREAVKNIDIEIEENNVKTIENKNPDGDEREEEIAEDRQEENSESEGTLIQLKQKDMYDVTIPWVVFEDDIAYVNYQNYEVSGEVFLAISNAMQELLGKEV